MFKGLFFIIFIVNIRTSSCAIEALYEADEEVKKVTDAINSKSRSVICIGKKFLQEQLELDVSTAYSYETEIMVGNLELKDAQEGIKSFVEKRKANWTHEFDKDEE